MDAPEEDADIRLRKISDDLLSEFDSTLEPFLRRAGSNTLRTRVRAREADRMVGLIDPFQELPQLLDSYLGRWLPILAEAFLGCVAQPAKVLPVSASSVSALVIPLQAAVARLLYTFCKVRGEKVVVGFLPVETRYLERLLGALEAQERRGEEDGSSGSSSSNNTDQWTWEERYVVLLWLAQLFLAPFDLATISTARAGDEEGDELPAIDGLVWPGQETADRADDDRRALPSITVRVLPLAMRYLAAPGKERDAARVLLVRVAMRRDMQRLGVRHALVQWALRSLQPRGPAAAASRTAYYCIGTLSFLAGILAAAAGASDMDDALAPIFAAVHAVAASEEQEDAALRADPVFTAVRSSALARKMMIKAVRAISVRYIQLGASSTAVDDDEVGQTTIETTIGYLLDRLADNDTPVRLAASKALSIIALQLDPDMAAQVIDAVLEGLDRNVLTIREGGTRQDRRDLSSVDPLEWHGLMLTLAHLLYRRSPPLEALPAIVAALQTGLAFERRSVSGSATGTNVRDAACFGIWALARRYTTVELRPLGVLQTLATALVVAACLDPAGNIRRGSSAALQELIGRHPDTIRAGIDLVQVVDYHAVALRGRAAADVALQATMLAPDMYGVALRDELLGWRGVSDAGDVAARRGAATSFGQIVQRLAVEGAEGTQNTTAAALRQFLRTVEDLSGRIARLQPRQVEERHGLLLALAAVLDALPGLVQTATEAHEICQEAVRRLLQVLQGCQTLALATTSRRLELLAEASSRLIMSSFPVLQAAKHNRDGDEGALVSGPALVAEANRVPATAFTQMISRLDHTTKMVAASEAESTPDSAAFANLSASLLSDVWLARQEPEVVDAASDAALVLLVLPSMQQDRSQTLIDAWAGIVRRPLGVSAGAASAKTAKTAKTSKTSKTRAGSRGGSGQGYVFALTKAYPLAMLRRGDEKEDDPISRAILDRWAADRSVETRVALLQALAQSPAVLLTTAAMTTTITTTPGSRFRAVLAAGLDDYTTDARGDVGSHVRLQALRATQALWALERPAGRGKAGPGEAALFLRVLRLAAEKLDRVRVAAQAALAQALGDPDSSQLLSLTFSSQTYFRRLLGLWDETGGDDSDDSKDRRSPAAAAARTGDDAATKWMAALLRGYVTSADTGNEELVIASRAALLDYTSNCQTAQTAQTAQQRRQLIWQALVRNLPGGTSARTTPPDRIVVPTLEIIAFLFYSGIFGQPAAPIPTDTDLVALCQQVHQAAEKTGSLRKLEACVKVYGAVVTAAQAGRDATSSQLACQQLAALLQHPWPRIRNAVIDELWSLGQMQRAVEPEPQEPAQSRFDVLKGVDWGTAEAETIAALLGRLGLVELRV